MEKTKSKAKKVAIIIAIVLASLILLAGILLLVEGLYVKITPASKYTLEEHIERISQRVDKRYIESGRYESYSMHPVYNEKEELTHFVIDFEPRGFLLVKLDEEIQDALNIITYSMYQEYSSYLDDSWRRYRVSKSDTAVFEPYNGHAWYRDKSVEPYNTAYPDATLLDYYKYYEKDEEGNYIRYDKNPFRVAGVDNSKLYFLNVGDDMSIPAVRDGDYFLNLISMERFHKDEYKGAEYYQENESSRLYESIPHLDMFFIFKKGL